MTFLVNEDVNEPGLWRACLFESGSYSGNPNVMHFGFGLSPNEAICSVREKITAQEKERKAVLVRAKEIRLIANKASKRSAA